MALDWNRPIGKGVSKRGSDAIPTKTSINLLVRNDREIDARKTVPFAVLLVVLIVLFAKFAVIDPLSQVSQKRSELSVAQASVAKMESELTNYDQVKLEYDSYASSAAGNVSATEVLDLVRTQVLPAGQVTAVSLKDDTLTVTLANTTLSDVGTLASSLRSQQNVAQVSVSTAATSSDTTSVMATLIISLQQSQE